jgi:hypothetical protein
VELEAHTRGRKACPSEERGNTMYDYGRLAMNDENWQEVELDKLAAELRAVEKLMQNAPVRIPCSDCEYGYWTEDGGKYDFCPEKEGGHCPNDAR